MEMQADLQRHCLSAQPKRRKRSWKSLKKTRCSWESTISWITLCCWQSRMHLTSLSGIPWMFATTAWMRPETRLATCTSVSSTTCRHSTSLKSQRRVGRRSCWARRNKGYLQCLQTSTRPGSWNSWERQCSPWTRRIILTFYNNFDNIFYLIWVNSPKMFWTIPTCPLWLTWLVKLSFM